MQVLKVSVLTKMYLIILNRRALGPQFGYKWKSRKVIYIFYFEVIFSKSLNLKRVESPVLLDGKYSHKWPTHFTPNPIRSTRDEI